MIRNSKLTVILTVVIFVSFYFTQFISIKIIFLNILVKYFDWSEDKNRRLKEERDIVIPSGIDYRKSHDKYMQIRDDYKDISNLIHRLNHSEVVNFKDE